MQPISACGATCSKKYFHNFTSPAFSSLSSSLFLSSFSFSSSFPFFFFPSFCLSLSLCFSLSFSSSLCSIACIAAIRQVTLKLVLLRKRRYVLASTNRIRTNAQISSNLGRKHEAFQPGQIQATVCVLETNLNGFL